MNTTVSTEKHRKSKSTKNTKVKVEGINKKNSNKAKPEFPIREAEAISGSLNKPEGTNETSPNSLNTRNTSPVKVEKINTEQRSSKLVNSNEQSRNDENLKKKEFLFDSYARITALKNEKRSLKKLGDFANKPKLNLLDPQAYNEHYTNLRSTVPIRKPVSLLKSNKK
ncbi:uncharacterized protein [Prorops nasuta]|uniref:uncharacterized protein n=1 Tax=Prorops nasuta TaxID=863751 RepID=UPI0034CD6894